jgi:hypothetical protein
MLILIPTFPAHGRCTFTVDSNIIIIDTLGPWNLEFFEILHSNLKKTVQENFKNKSYGIVVVLKGETLATQEGLNYHLSQVKQGNATAIAINMIHSSFALTTQIQFEAVYNKAGLRNEFFTDTTIAKEWIKSVLLSI